MTGDLLYIDGVAVDLGEGVDITLNYKSNLLTELDKIVGNVSYTIKLPKTVRNLGIIGNSDIPAGVGEYPREVHDCRYFRNGVEVIPSGSAVLLGVGDSIEVVLTWGGASALRRAVEDDKNLDNLIGKGDYVNWSKNASAFPYTGTDKVLFSDMNIGLTGESELAALHPCVRSTYVFDRLKDVYGLTVEVDESRRAFVESLLIPLVTRKGGEVHAGESAIGLTFLNNDMTSMTSPFGWVITSNGSLARSYFRVNEFDFDDNWGDEIVQNIVALVDMHLTIRPDIRGSVPDLKVNYGTDYLDSEIPLPYTEENGVYVYDTAVELDLLAGDGFRVTYGLGVEYGSTVGVSAVPDEVAVGGKFSIVENLPEISCVDFLKSIAAVSGTFAVPSATGEVVRFVPYDVLDDRSGALDWTDRLIVAGWDGGARDVAYTLDDYARYNRFKWKSDDTVTLKDSGVIRVDDRTLDYERDAVELPFAATDTRGGKASIRLYEYNDDGDPEIQSVSPRLLVEKDVEGLSTATFNDLRWARVLGAYYGALSRAVLHPVVITEYLYLDEFTLRDLDLSVPVYLGQYGRYYAVVEVKAPKSGVCECKLLQLDI